MYMYIYFGNVVTPQISFIQVKGLSYLKEVSGNFFLIDPPSKAKSRPPAILVQGPLR